MHASATHLRFFTLAFLAAVFPGALYVPQARAQQTVTGDLGVTGILDVNGAYFNLGTSAYDTSKYGFNVGYAEDTSTYAATLTLTATRPTATWLWQQAAPSNGTGSVPKMRLSSGNVLTLYDQTSPTPNASIVLDPVNGSTFTASATFNGTSNLMPNQNLDGGANSVLTQGLADSRYLVPARNGAISVGYNANAGSATSIAAGVNAQSTSVSTTAVGTSSSASGDYAVAIGANAVAIGTQTIAMGYESFAQIPTAVAIGSYSYANNTASVAIGNHAYAVGPHSLSLGDGAVTTAWYTAALGANASASADGASALAFYANASGYCADALGVGSAASNGYAVTLGNGSGAGGYASTALGFHSAASGDYATAVGNFSNASGMYATALATNAVASGDYSMAGGNTTAGGYYQFAIGRNSVPNGNPHTWVATEDLFTIGNGDTPAAPSNAFSVKKNGNAAFKGVVTVAPGGDIPMYTGSPQ